MSIELIMPSNHLILCHPLLLTSIFPSIRDFPNESVFHIRWPKYWSFSFSISPSREYSGLISFRIDWFDLLVVQGTRKSLFQHHSFKTSILWHSAFFMVQLSHLYTNTGKNHSFDYMDLCQQSDIFTFNMLSRFVIAFLPRSKSLLISWLLSLSTVILEPKKIKSVTVSPTIFYEVMGPDAMILVFWMLSFKPAFSLFSHRYKRLFHSSLLFAIRVMISAYLRLWYFSQQSWFQLVLHPAWYFTWCTLYIS